MTTRNASETNNAGRLMALAVLAVVPAVIFWPILRGTHTLYPFDLLHEVFLPFAAAHDGINVQVTAVSDYLYVFYPLRAFMQQVFAAGDLPLWNPYLYGGHPAFASPGSVATLDVFNVLFLVTDLPTALAWRAYLQVVVCAVIMFAYVRHLGVSQWAAVAAAVAFSLNSMFWANIFDWSLNSVLWLPLVLLLLERAIARSGVPGAICAGLVLGVALLGSVLQFYAFNVMAILGLWLARIAVDRTRPFRREATVVAITLCVGIGISSVQLVPTLELVAESTRRLTDSGHGMRSLKGMVTGTMALVTFVFPPLAGRLKDGMMLAQAWEGTTHYQGYIGVLGIILASIAAVCADRRRAVPFVILALGAIALVLYTPLSIFLYERFFIVYAFGAAALAAIGFEYLRRDDIDTRRVTAVLKVFGVFFVVIAVGAAMWTVAFTLYRAPILQAAESQLQDIIRGRYLGTEVALHVRKLHATLDGFTLMSHAMLVPLAIACGSLSVVWLRVLGRINASQFSMAAIAVLAFDLAYSAVTHIPFVDVRRYPLFPPSPSLALLQQDRDLFRTISLRNYWSDPPVLSLAMPSMYGLQTVEGKDNLAPLNFWSGLTRDLTSSGFDANNFALLNPLNIKYVMATPSVALPSSQFEQVYRGEVSIYRNRDVLPRAFMVRAYRVVPDRAEALRLLQQNAFDPGELVILDREPPAMAGAAQASQTGVEITRYEPRTVQIATDATTSQLLVLGDTYYPGWKATVDGASTPVLRANAFMRAVVIPPGAHSVTFRYEPVSFAAGLALTGGTGLLSALALFAHAVMRLRHSPEVSANSIGYV